MNKPILVVMAAGMGSRFGGLKQIAPVDENGHILIDYSLYDAVRAGFERVIFIIKDEIEKDFREIIGNRIEKHMEVNYAYQRLDTLPNGFKVPEGRGKPWGTAHAVLSAKDFIDDGIAVINADDFYGAGTYEMIYKFLRENDKSNLHALAGYTLGNTLTDNGHVARGVCKTDGDRLIEITERTHIEKRQDCAAYTEDGVNFTLLPPDTAVSMNFWGFNRSIIDEIEKRFPVWLKENLQANPLKCEYYVPSAVGAMLEDKTVQVKVLPALDKWYGVTYADDMPAVKAALKQMREDGKYPEGLLE